MKKIFLLVMGVSLLLISGCEPMSSDAINISSANTILQCTVGDEDEIVFFYIDGNKSKAELQGQQFPAQSYENQQSEVVVEMPLFGSRTVINKKTGKGTMANKKFPDKAANIACKNK